MILKRDDEIVPDEFQNDPQGVYITFVVENADDVFEIAKAEGFEVLREPAETFYGQRRLLLKDPNGALVNVSFPIPNFYKTW